MVTENMWRTHEGKLFFFVGKKNTICDHALDLISSLKQIKQHELTPYLFLYVSSMMKVLKINNISKYTSSREFLY